MTANVDGLPGTVQRDGLDAIYMPVQEVQLGFGEE